MGIKAEKRDGPDRGERSLEDQSQRNAQEKLGRNRKSGVDPIQGTEEAGRGHALDPEINATGTETEEIGDETGGVDEVEVAGIGEVEVEHGEKNKGGKLKSKCGRWRRWGWRCPNTTKRVLLTQSVMPSKCKSESYCGKRPRRRRARRSPQSRRSKKSVIRWKPRLAQALRPLSTSGKPPTLATTVPTKSFDV